MSNEIEVVEVCPFCSRENILQWNVHADGFKAFCPHCGHRMLLCSECMALQDDPKHCDWNKVTDLCFRCAELHMKALITAYSNEEFDAKPDFSDPKNVGLAYTTSEDGEHNLQVSFDLETKEMVGFYDDKEVAREGYESEDQCLADLASITFDNLISWLLDKIDQIKED